MGLTDLDGKTYTDSNWIALPFAAGFAQWDVGWYSCVYRKVDSAVYIEGLARCTVANSSTGYITLATLPTGFRPSRLHSPILWSSAGSRVVVVQPDGQIMTGGPLAVNEGVWLNYSFLTS